MYGVEKKLFTNILRCKYSIRQYLYIREKKITEFHIIFAKLCMLKKIAPLKNWILLKSGGKKHALIIFRELISYKTMCLYVTWVI